MNRWSFIKRVGKITYKDFMHFAEQFRRTISLHCESLLQITIVLYKNLPHSITVPDPAGITDKWLAEDNKRKELIRVFGLENVTEDLFDKAVNIQLYIRPINDDKKSEFTFGYLECKGLLPRHFVYYVLPKEIGCSIKNLCLAKTDHHYCYSELVMASNVATPFRSINKLSNRNPKLFGFFCFLIMCAPMKD